MTISCGRLVIEPPALPREVLNEILEDFSDLGWRATPIDIVSLGIYAVNRIGKRVERLPEVVGQLQTCMSDYFDQRVPPDLIGELMLSSTEIMYYELVKTLLYYGLQNHHIEVLGHWHDGMILEVSGG